MIAIGANVLVRYLTQDAKSESARARAFLDSEISEDEPGFVPLIVVCELVWVLRGRYGATRTQLADWLENIAVTAALIVENKQAFAAALAAFKASNANFADCLIAEIARQEGCREIVTFDKEFASLPNVRRLN